MSQRSNPMMARSFLFHIFSPVGICCRPLLTSDSKGCRKWPAARRSRRKSDASSRTSTCLDTAISVAIASSTVCAIFKIRCAIHVKDCGCGRPEVCSERHYFLPSFSGCLYHDTGQQAADDLSLLFGVIGGLNGAQTSL